MLYSLRQVRDEPVFVWIIDEMDHSSYEQLFGYG